MLSNERVVNTELEAFVATVSIVDSKNPVTQARSKLLRSDGPSVRSTNAIPVIGARTLTAARKVLNTSTTYYGSLSPDLINNVMFSIDFS